MFFFLLSNKGVTLNLLENYLHEDGAIWAKSTGNWYKVEVNVVTWDAVMTFFFLLQTLHVSRLKKNRQKKCSLFFPPLSFLPSFSALREIICKLTNLVEKFPQKKQKYGVVKLLKNVWTDTVWSISVQTWQENKGKRDVSCSITDTTVQYSTYIVWVITVSFMHTQLTFPFSLIPSGEAVNESWYPACHQVFSTT